MKGILLDIDGTLVLSNDAHAHAWVESFEHHGYTVTFDQVRPLIGMGGDQLMPKLVSELYTESGTGKQIGDYRNKLFLDKYAPNLHAAPGSRELVRRFQQDGHKLIAASSASKTTLGSLLKAAQVEDLLREATTSSEADNSKPEPDIVVAALEKIGMLPEQTFMIGDTPYDLEAATHAGVKLVAVRCGGWSDADLAGSS